MVVAKAFIKNGKTAYVADNNTITALKSMYAAHEGAAIIKIFMLADEAASTLNNQNVFFRTIMLPPLFEAMKLTYQLSSIGECEALLYRFHSVVKKQKNDGKEYEIYPSLECMSEVDKSFFIGKVAVFAAEKFSIKFPNIKEIEAMGNK